MCRAKDHSVIGFRRPRSMSQVRQKRRPTGQADQADRLSGTAQSEPDIDYASSGTAAAKATAVDSDGNVYRH
jgi:hypothetical protein